MEILPIDSHLPEIASVLSTTQALVLTAPPGAGKTTRIPRFLYEQGFAADGEILILEPRRLAARLAASRVAQELGENPGGTVGYSIRFENVGCPGTSIRFLTEAILVRKMIQDPNLKGVSVVILDEFHERHLATDLALAFLKRLQFRNPQLKIVVMSATLDAEPVAAFLTEARRISLGELRFDLNIEYEEKIDPRPLHEKVASAVVKLFRSGIDGDILVFLPGSAEIRRSAEALTPVAERLGFVINFLHGDLAVSEQKRALEPVILSTNVAETSITIPGIAAVIDSGLVRVAGHSSWSGFPTLFTSKISKSSAMQRAGRAGRTQAGRVLRLYTRPDFESRPAQETPEIMRADLTETVLMLHGAGIRDIHSFPWFESPPDLALEAAETLLIRLGAIDAAGQISKTGQQMLQLPIHPRIARLILEGKKLQVAEDAMLLAALLSERDIRREVRTGVGFSKLKTPTPSSGTSDLLELLDRYQEAEAVRFASEQMQALGLDIRAVQAVRQAQRQLRRILPVTKSLASSRSEEKQREEALLLSVLAAYPDRVAKRRKPNSQELMLSAGGSARLSPMSVVHVPMFLVAVDVEERKQANSNLFSGTAVRLASAIEIEWLAGLFPESISQKTNLIWNESAERVEEVRSTSYEQLSLEEITRTAPPSLEASTILASALYARGISFFQDHASIAAFQAKVALLTTHFPEEKWTPIKDKEIREGVLRLCSGRGSFQEMASLSLLDCLMEKLTNRQRDLLAKETPERIPLKSGRTVRVHYESSKSPWIEARLQDFFGTYSMPQICRRQVSLTIHLLAPNGRPVQVTQDLAGFWERHYPTIRRELQRRYPKHAWPEKAAGIRQ
jgi:ATP-dependent helicase HrpB